MHREDDCPCHTCTCRCHETGTGPDSTVEPLYTRLQLRQLDELYNAAWARVLRALDTGNKTHHPDDLMHYERASAYRDAIADVCQVVNKGVLPEWVGNER